MLDVLRSDETNVDLAKKERKEIKQGLFSEVGGQLSSMRHHYHILVKIKSNFNLREVWPR